MRRLLIAFAVLLGLGNHACAFLLTGGATSGGVTITGVNLSTNSFLTSCADSTVIATISTTTTGGSFTGSYSLSGTDAASFKVSGSSLECNGTVAAGTYSINVIATMAGASGSPFTQPETLTGSATPSTVTMQVIETTGTTQHNVPVIIGIPLCPSGVSWCTALSMSSSQHLAVSDTINGSLNCSEDLRYSDIGGLTSGTPAQRGTFLSCNIPTLTLNTDDTLTGTVTSGAPSTGTDISIADIIAAASNDLNAKVTLTDQSGNTYTASPMTAFSSGNTSYVNATTAAVMGKFHSGGGILTSYIAYVPLKTSGGTAHSQLYAHFEVECYKATSAAVSGGNPITQCNTGVAIGSSTAQNVSPDNTRYGLSIGPGGSCASFPTVSPATNATLSGNTAGQNETLTLTGGSLNDLGKVYDDGTGYGIVDKYTNSTTELIAVIVPFASTTLTNGSYKVYGVNQPYGSALHFECPWVPSGTPSNVSVENGNLYIGAAWSGTTGGPGSYFIGSGLLLNYLNPISSITNEACFTYQGNNPSAWFTVNAAGQGWLGSGAICDYEGDLEATGDNNVLGPQPWPYVSGLIKYDSIAASQIFQDADAIHTAPETWIDTGTGMPPTYSQGTNWATNPAFSGSITVLAAPSTNMSPWTSLPEWAHWPEGSYVPYIMRGRWWDLLGSINAAFANWANRNPGYSGSGINRTLFFNGNQMRGDFWGHRTIARLALVLPDIDTNSSPMGALGNWTKTDVQSYLELAYTTTNSNNYSVSPYPGANIYLGIGSCPGGATCNPNFISDGVRYTSSNNSSFGSGTFFSVYQVGYGMFAEAGNYEEGMLSPNGLAFWSWVAEGEVSMITSPDVYPIANAVGYFLPVNANGQSGGGTIYYDWADVYKTMAIQGAGQNVLTFTQCNSCTLNSRIPSGTMTLSGTSGAITVTLPASGYLTNGGNWYVGGGINTADGGACTITSVSLPVTLGCTTTATFGTTSYTNTAFTSAGEHWSMPFPFPGDTVGLEFAGTETLFSTSPPVDYMMITQNGLLLVDEYLSVSGSSTAHTTVLNYTGGVISPSGGGLLHWDIGHR